ncbi:MAG: hypothetical protein MI924_25845 [Chloroflexales bacterium]|nr:hypothetical protein [Chloroflexales bacterium]
MVASVTRGSFGHQNGKRDVTASAAPTVTAGYTPPDTPPSANGNGTHLLPADSPPDGWQLMKCDRYGAYSRYGVYWMCIDRHGERTEPTQYRDEAISDAWKLAGKGGSRETVRWVQPSFCVAQSGQPSPVLQRQVQASGLPSS